MKTLSRKFINNVNSPFMTKIEWMFYYDKLKHPMLGCIGKWFPGESYVEDLFYMRFSREVFRMKRLLKKIYHELPDQIHREKPEGYIQLRFLIRARINKKQEKYYDID